MATAKSRNLTADATVSAHGAEAAQLDTLIPTCRGLYIGATGNLNVTMADGQTVTFNSVPVGILPIQVQQINSAGTSASSILVLY